MSGKHGRILTATAVVGAVALSYGQSLIVDHAAVKKFDSIPDRWLDSVKTMLIQYVGQSHGRQVPKGLELLEAQNAVYGVQLGTNPNQLTEPNALKVVRSFGTGTSWSTATSVGDERYWSTPDGRQRTETTARQAISEHHPFRISLWCWCWDICSPDYCYNEAGTLITFNDERMAAYKAAIKRFNDSFPVIKFIYHTSITDTRVGENGWRVTRYNDSIRAAAAAQNGILFDQADIENWNGANTARRIDTWDGHTLYLRHADYDEDVGTAFHDGHTNEALCIRKAKGLWYLLARLAGWDGGASTAVSTPAISPASGTYQDSVRVSIACATPGATIRYTTDGTDPQESSSLCTASFKVTANATVKAKAWASGLSASGIASVVYSITTTQTVATPVLTPAGATYNDSVIVTMSCATSGATIRFTTNGADPTASSDAYSTPIRILQTTTVKAMALATGMNQSPIASARYVITPTPKTATPTVSPAAGSYNDSVSVVLSCGTPDAVIRYTTDSTKPSGNSPVYTTPLSITKTTTIMAIAFAPAMNPSDIVIAKYIVVPTITATGPDGSNSPLLQLSHGTGALEIVYPNGRRMILKNAHNCDELRCARGSAFPTGVYFVRVAGRTKQNTFKKIVILR